MIMTDRRGAQGRRLRAAKSTEGCTRHARRAPSAAAQTVRTEFDNHGEALDYALQWRDAPRDARSSPTSAMRHVAVGESSARLSPSTPRAPAPGREERTSRCTRAMRGRWWSHRLTVATHWRGREVTNSNSCDLPFGASVQVASSLNLRSPQT